MSLTAMARGAQQRLASPRRRHARYPARDGTRPGAL
jgi:hypothetical protein